MTRYLSERDIDALLSMDDTIEVLDQALREQGRGEAMNRPRQRVMADSTMLHVLPASLPSAESLGLKAYTTGPNGAKFWLLLFGTGGELKSIMEADRIGQLRTGAASGVATRYMSREDSRTVAMIGTGYQARTQLEAVCAVRPIERVKVWSRKRENVERYCREMGEQLGLPLEPADNAEAAVRDADVVITMTSAKEPVVKGEWLAPGTHLNVAGSNKASHREIDAAAVAAARLVVADDLEQSKVESGDLLAAVREGALAWERVQELSKVVAGELPGRYDPDDVTLFKSHGVGLWDVAAASRAFELAEERGVGRSI